MTRFEPPSWLQFREILPVTVVVSCAMLAGCGPPATVVMGVVTVDETPVPDALVEFFPVSGQGRVSVATTDAAGCYRVEASPVEMSVVINATKKLGTKTSAGGMPVIEFQNLISKRYNSHATTPLKAVPVKHQTITANFNLPSSDK